MFCIYQFSFTVFVLNYILLKYLFLGNDCQYPLCDYDLYTKFVKSSRKILNLLFYIKICQLIDMKNEKKSDKYRQMQ